VRTAAVVEDAQRLYALGRLVQPEAVPGRLRRADLSEREMMIKWWSAFQVETGSPVSEVSPVVDSALSTGRLFVWDDAGARCMARATGPLGGISRIGAVFTPPQWRRRGYAAACVGALCEWVRSAEGANSVLYAQLRNPGSNAIYRRLGFEAVSEVLLYRFDDVVNGR
jgi:predicted GNAT family acetyltransferase